MPGKAKIFARSISRQWTALIRRNPANVLIVSPYLTSWTADTVIGAALADSCEIYTLFCIEVFASGASSLPTVKRLVAGGYRVHQVEGLHAKVVLTDEAFSVGSQNLTARPAQHRGFRNRQ
jgi:phosphatidylserine/phosphatidylglycerophosphate/cardiolipin synthase-like enzyme